MLTFKPVTLEDRPVIELFLNKIQPRFCLHTFQGLYIWRHQICLQYAVYKEFIVFKTCFEYRYNYLFPIGKGDYNEVLNEIKNDAETLNFSYAVYQILEEQLPIIEQFAKVNKMFIKPVRDYFEYWYDTQKMIHLPGKKLQPKRNHINYFIKNFIWKYEPITSKNVSQCIDFVKNWESLKNEPDNAFLHEDDLLFIDSLSSMDILNLEGGMLKIENEIMALGLGCRLNSEVFMILFEKARGDIKGAYPMIFQQFVKHHCFNYKYVSRLEDVGDEGLRKAKLSYHPDILQPVYKMTPQV